MEEKVVIQVQVDTGRVAAELNVVSASLGQLKDEQRALKKEMETSIDATGELSKQYAANEAEIKALTAQQKALTGQLQASSAEGVVLGDSFRELDAACRQLENQYKSLTAAQRESAEGQELKAKLIETKERLKEFDAELGNHQRNVGNYPKAWDGVIGKLQNFSKVGDNTKAMIKTITDGASKAPAAFKGIASSIGEATKAALKFIATPIGAILAAIVVAVKIVSAAFDKLKEAFAKNDTAATSLQKLMASFRPILDAVSAAFDKLASALGVVAEKLANWIGGMSEAAAESQKLVQAVDDLEEAERQYTEKSAERNRDIAKLRAEAADKESYSLEERRKRLQEAINLEKKNLEDEKHIKAEQLRILEETARRERDTSDETKNRIVAARAAMFQAEQNYYTGVRSLQKQLTSFDKEEANDQKQAAAQAAAEARARRQAAAQAAKQAAAERKQRQQQAAAQAKAYSELRTSIAKETEDALLAIEKDETVKRVAQLKLQGEREVAELRAKMNQLKKTDKEARDNIQKMITAKEQETQDAIAEVLFLAQQEREQKARDNARAAMENQTKDALELMRLRVQYTQEDYDRLSALTDEEINILYSSWDDYNAALIAADKARDDAREAQQAESFARMQLAQENELEQRRIAAGENEIALAQIEIDAAAFENEQLLEMDEDTKRRLYGSQEAYEAAMIASNKRMADATKQYTDTMRKDAITKVQAISGAIGALGDLLDQFGEQNKAAAVASKAIALGQIAVQTGIAIAAGVAQAQDVGFPANIAAIATTVATIIGNIATAISTVKSAKFAEGGIVGGTSYTGDQVAARLNSREMVLTLDQQGTLFDALSSGDGQLGINYELMAEAVAAQQPPTVVYSELKEFEQKVVTYNEIASV